jgi:hypothetical protein
MTAYTVAPEWEHGDFPLAADLNKIGTGQTHIYEIALTYARNPASRSLADLSAENINFTHRHRWLHYKSTGQVVDPSGAEEDVELPNPSDNWINVYDLDSIAWLEYGALYTVAGVDMACEQEEA